MVFGWLFTLVVTHHEVSCLCFLMAAPATLLSLERKKEGVGSFSLKRVPTVNHIGLQLARLTGSLLILDIFTGCVDFLVKME